MPAILASRAIRFGQHLSLIQEIVMDPAAAMHALRRGGRPRIFNMPIGGRVARSSAMQHLVALGGTELVTAS